MMRALAMASECSEEATKGLTPLHYVLPNAPHLTCALHAVRRDSNPLWIAIVKNS